MPSPTAAAAASGMVGNTFEYISQGDLVSFHNLPFWREKWIVLIIFACQSCLGSFAFHHWHAADCIACNACSDNHAQLLRGFCGWGEVKQNHHRRVHLSESNWIIFFDVLNRNAIRYHRLVCVYAFRLDCSLCCSTTCCRYSISTYAPFQKNGYADL